MGIKLAGIYKVKKEGERERVQYVSKLKELKSNAM